MLPANPPYATDLMGPIVPYDGDGVMFDDDARIPYVHDGGLYTCESGVGLVELGVADGFLCHADDECASGSCSPRPRPR